MAGGSTQSSAMAGRGTRPWPTRPASCWPCPSPIDDIWNDGRCRGPEWGPRRGRRPGLLLAVVDDVGERVPIDRSRSYVLGMSHGATMVGRLVAIAQISGTVTLDVVTRHGSESRDNGLADAPSVAQVAPDVSVCRWPAKPSGSDVVFYRIDGGGRTGRARRMPCRTSWAGRARRSTHRARAGSSWRRLGVSRQADDGPGGVC